jgi:hypothetical protein
VISKVRTRQFQVIDSGTEPVDKDSGIIPNRTTTFVKESDDVNMSFVVSMRSIGFIIQ